MVQNYQSNSNPSYQATANGFREMFTMESKPMGDTNQTANEKTGTIGNDRP